MSRRDYLLADAQALLECEGEPVFFSGKAITGIFHLKGDRDDNGGLSGVPAAVAELWLLRDDLPEGWRGAEVQVRGEPWRASRKEATGEIFCCLELVGSGVAFS